MAMPPELKPLIAQARRQVPELSGLGDKQVAEILLGATVAQQGAAAGEGDIEMMSAHECGAHGERLLNSGQWQEAERFFLAALEKAEGEKDTGLQMKTATALGRLLEDWLDNWPP